MVLVHMLPTPIRFADTLILPWRFTSNIFCNQIIKCPPLLQILIVTITVQDQFDRALLGSEQCVKRS